jgi:hypothetical protein
MIPEGIAALRKILPTQGRDGSGVIVKKVGQTAGIKPVGNNRAGSRRDPGPGTRVATSQDIGHGTTGQGKRKP